MDDTISRQAAIDEFEITPFNDYGDYMRAVEVINNLPSRQPERKKGKWIDGYKRQTCSVCKQRGYRSWNFCPNCGCDMGGK